MKSKKIKEKKQSDSKKRLYWTIDENGFVIPDTVLDDYVKAPSMDEYGHSDFSKDRVSESRDIFKESQTVLGWKKQSKNIAIEDLHLICPICKKVFFYIEMYDHILANHFNIKPRVIINMFDQKIEQCLKDEKYEFFNNPLSIAERFYQSQDEVRDGGKYLGFMRRENGRFGSLPLYDDYGDESDPK